jgi:hypothetical protein
MNMGKTSETQLTTERRMQLIDEVVESSNMAVIESMPKLAQGLVLGKAMKQLRELVDDSIMADVMALQGSELGFRTDKDREGGYTAEVVKDAAIHALLRGASVTGNEFNVISGKCYLTKEYYQRQVAALVDDLRIVEHVPQLRDGGALVPMEASWIYNGRRDELKCLKTDDGDARIAVRVNKGMGVDAVLGKATRKLLARIYRRVTGSNWLEADADADVSDSHAEAAPTPPVAKIEPPSDPLAGLDSALDACETIAEVNAIQNATERQINTEGDYELLHAACERRRDEIRNERGERSNGKDEAA